VGEIRHRAAVEVGAVELPELASDGAIALERPRVLRDSGHILQPDPRGAVGLHEITDIPGRGRASRKIVQDAGAIQLQLPERPVPCGWRHSRSFGGPSLQDDRPRDRSTSIVGGPLESPDTETLPGTA